MNKLQNNQEPSKKTVHETSFSRCRFTSNILINTQCIPLLLLFLIMRLKMSRIAQYGSDTYSYVSYTRCRSFHQFYFSLQCLTLKSYLVQRFGRAHHWACTTPKGTPSPSTPSPVVATALRMDSAEISRTHRYFRSRRAAWPLAAADQRLCTNARASAISESSRSTQRAAQNYSHRCGAFGVSAVNLSA